MNKYMWIAVLLCLVASFMVWLGPPIDTGDEGRMLFYPKYYVTGIDLHHLHESEFTMLSIHTVNGAAFWTKDANTYKYWSFEY